MRRISKPFRLVLGRRTCRLSLVLAAVLVAGCATAPLPNPKTQDGSLLVVGFKQEFETAVLVQSDYSIGRLVVDGTRIEVPARSVVYIGDFTVRYKQTLVPHGYQVVDTSGGKSDQGKARALDFLKKRYGSSPWATYTYAR